jgi:hypothetical protein
MDFCGFGLGFYTVETMVSIVLLQEVRRVQLVFCFPGIVGFRISFPLKEILELFVLPEVAMTSDGFHFVFHFPVDKVRWWPREVRAMGTCFDVWG